MDIDSNAATPRNSPVESIAWPEGKAPAGEYVVEVVRYATRTLQPVDFVVELRIDGKVVEVHRGRASNDSPQRVFSFKIPYGNAGRP